MIWRVRRLTFAYDSPLVHSYSAAAVGYGSIALLMALFLPLALPPEFFPLVLTAMALAAAFMTGHAPKQI